MPGLAGIKELHFSWHLAELIFSFVKIEKFLEGLHSLQKKKKKSSS